LRLLDIYSSRLSASDEEAIIVSFLFTSCFCCEISKDHFSMVPESQDTKNKS
jgi:hypothetical protein